MEFCLLGPLAVRRGETVVRVQAGKQRAVLAALLLNANRVVAVEELAETLWGAVPPPSARLTVQNYVLRLRKGLGDAGRSRIRTQPPGYVISVAAGELDLTRFEVLLGAAWEAARDRSWDTAAAQARAALALWQGEPLADVESDLLAEREVPRLANLRLQALETRIEADLHLGEHAEVTDELRQLVAAHPLREHLHALLMLALYRCGRRAEALAAYQHARDVLVDELGIEPGQELRELHRQILSADTALELPAPWSPAGGTGRAVPRELPAAVRHFTGRAGELEALTRLLDEPVRKPGVVVISAIGGTPGVGKTALAVHWAHQVAERFPDGQMYVNLRGYDAGQPVSAADALAGFLRALHVPGQDIPADQEERAARYRSLLAGTQMLIVLDNAGNVEQVRPLLPGAPSCAVLVTSRDALAGLVARDGAARLDLDLFPLDEAVALLRSLIGPRADDDPAAAVQLAELCARLPLALRIAAELAAARRQAPLAVLVGELADQQQRLDLLDAVGDSRTAVRAVFSWSYRNLDAGAARAFRLAGLHPGPDLDPYALAALTDSTVRQARRVLDVLARAHLVQMTGLGRHGLHDLLRAYARELAATSDREDGQCAALTRLFDHYLYTAAVAMDSLHPAEHHRRPRIPPPSTAAPPVNDPDAAHAWLDAERATLVAMTAHAARRGWPAHATKLAATLSRYLENGSHYPEAITIYGHAGAAARRAGDRAAEATTLNALGGVHRRQGDYQQAAAHLEKALELFRQTADRAGQARALNNLGMIHHQQGRYQQAAELCWKSVNVFREIGDRFGEAKALDTLGIVLRQQGHYEQAISHHRDALTLGRKLGDLDGQAYALGYLGAIYLRQGCYQEAADSLQQALALFRQTRDRAGETDALIRLGAVCLGQRHLRQAASHLQEALALSRETGEQASEAEALNGLGEILLANGYPHHADARHTTALDLASQIGDKYQQARAHDGLGHVCNDTGDPHKARRHWQESLAIYEELGVPEADQVRAQLTAAQTLT